MFERVKQFSSKWGVQMGRRAETLMGSQQGKAISVLRWQRNTAFDKPSLLAFLTSSRFFKFSCGLLVALITQKLGYGGIPQGTLLLGFLPFFFLFFLLCVCVSRHTSTTFIMNLAVLGIRNAIIMIKDMSVRK